MTRDRARRANSVWANLPLRGKGLVVIAIPLVALLSMTLSLSLLMRQDREATAWVTHSAEVQAEIQDVLALLVDAETGTRGYLLTGQNGFLQTYQLAQVALPEHLARLTMLVQDNPDQSSRVERIVPLATQKLAVLSALQTSGTPGAALSPGAQQQLVSSNALMQTLRQELGAMQDDEARLLVARSARVKQLDARALVTTAISLLVGLVGGLLAMLLFTDGVVGRVHKLEETAGRLARGLPLLETPGGADEIGRLGRSVGAAAALLQERELQLTRSLGELERRTADLEAKTAEQESFIYTVSHDLRAPLVSLQGLAGALIEDYGAELPAGGRRYLDRIVANADKLQALISDLLELARLSRVEVEFTPVLLDQIVRDVIDNLGHTLVSRGAVVRGVERLPAVVANPAQMSQLFTNLIDNAVKYTPPERSPLIQLGAVEQPECWEVTVRDNGIGIPAAMHEKVFAIFQRLPAGKTLNPTGSGVGLAIVARIVATHGGRLRLESREGSGTTFRLTLPKRDAGAAAERDQHTADRAGRRPVEKAA